MVSTVGTLTLCPRFPLGFEVQRRAVQSPRSSGQNVRRQVMSSTSRNSSKREILLWHLNFGPIPKSERDTLQAHFDDTLAGVLAVAWQPPDFGSTIPVRFLDEVLRFEWVRASDYRVRFTLEEAI